MLYGTIYGFQQKQSRWISFVTQETVVGREHTVFQHIPKQVMQINVGTFHPPSVLKQPQHFFLKNS